MRRLNSFSHQDTGQNVLFADGHVNFETLPTVGIDSDNIYTYWTTTTYTVNGDNQLAGTIPVFKQAASRPAEARDSLLLSEEFPQ